MKKKTKKTLPDYTCHILQVIGIRVFTALPSGEKCLQTNVSLRTTSSSRIDVCLAASPLRNKSAVFKDLYGS